MKLLMILAAVANTACSTLAPPKSPAEAMYRRRCGNCHELHPPAAYSDADWTVNVQRMRVNAGLSNEDVRDLVAWLKANNQQ